MKTNQVPPPEVIYEAPRLDRYSILVEQGFTASVTTDDPIDPWNPNGSFDAD